MFVFIGGVGTGVTRYAETNSSKNLIEGWWLVQMTFPGGLKMVKAPFSGGEVLLVLGFFLAIFELHRDMHVGI